MGKLEDVTASRPGGGGEFKCAAAYPSAERSMKLGEQNLHLFRLKNTRFDFIGGGIYFLIVVGPFAYLIGWLYCFQLFTAGRTNWLVVLFPTVHCWEDKIPWKALLATTFFALPYTVLYTFSPSLFDVEQICQEFAKFTLPKAIEESCSSWFVQPYLCSLPLYAPFQGPAVDWTTTMEVTAGSHVVSEGELLGLE